MPFGWRAQFKRFGFAGEILMPHKVTILLRLVGGPEFIVDMEWRSLPAIRGLHFDRPWFPVEA